MLATGTHSQGWAVEGEVSATAPEGHTLTRRGRLVARAVLVAFALACALVAAALGRSSQLTSPGAAGKIAVPSRDGIELMNPDGTSRTRITANHATGVVWSPDGKWLAYSTSPEPWVIRVVRADGSGDREVLAAGAEPLMLHPAFAWSPNGAEIAYACPTGLCVVNVASGTTRRLLDVPAGIGSAQPSWAPDGSKLAFQCSLGRGICIVSLNTPSSIVSLTFSADSGSRAQFPDWSPDSSRLLVTVRTKLYVVGPGETEARLLVDMGGTLLAHGRWSPDGQSALVGSFPDLYVMRVNGGTPMKLGPGGGADWGTSPALIVAGAQLQARWILSKQVGTLVLEGTASHPTDLVVTLKSATRAYAPLSIAVPAGAVSARLKLPRGMAPGQYQAEVSGSSGTERVLSTSVSVALPEPATGLVSRSEISDRRNGQARARVPRTTKLLYARFHLSVRPAPGQTLRAIWLAPSGAIRYRQTVAPAAVVRSTLAKIPPLQAGRWRCRLEAGTTPLAIASIRVG